MTTNKGRELQAPPTVHGHLEPDELKWIDANPEAALDSPHAADRQLAAFVLSGRALGHALPKLRSLLEDPSSDVRDSAGQALGSVGDEAAFDRLVQLLDASPPRDTLGIAWAVAEVGLRRPRLRNQSQYALERWRKRTRGFSRRHAEALLGRLVAPSQTHDRLRKGARPSAAASVA